MMEQYCAHCGARLRQGARFCQECGKPVGGNPSISPMDPILQDGAKQLAHGALCTARLFAVVLMGGGAIASGLAACSLLGITAWILYEFATGQSVWVPWLAGASLQGPALLTVGLMAAFITVLLLAVMMALFHSVHSFTHRSTG